MSDERLDAGLRAALRTVARTPHLLVGCDYDGTLAPIVEDPALAAPIRESIAALRTLAGLPSTTVAVVSGRALRDLAALSRLPPEIHLVGSHGSEFDIDFVHALDTDQTRLRSQVLVALHAITDGVSGVLLEQKPAGIAVHVRQASRADAAAVLDAVRRGPASLDGVHATEGKEVLELSVVQTDKGDALAILRHRAGASAAVFIGDDTTDESAFARLTGPDVSVKVGPGETTATFRISDPADVSVLLALLAEERAAWLAGADATPIEALTLLADGVNVALLTPDGDITWLCHPEPDSPALFADLLGGPGAGVLSVHPARGGLPLGQEYVGNTLIVRTRWAGLAVVDYLDRSPFPGAEEPGETGMGRAHLTRLIREISGRTPARIVFAPRPEFGSVPARLECVVSDDGAQVGVRMIGAAEPVGLRAPGVTWEIRNDGAHDTAIAIVDPSMMPGGRVVLELRAGTDDLGPAPLEDSRRHDYTAGRWESWASRLNLPTGYRAEVMRSALTLKALCHGRTGGVLAAATTSLPEGLGGIRNWDYRYAWVRDGAMTVQALLSLGSPTEAIAYLQWLERIVNEAGNAEHLRPLYSLHGHTLGPEAVIEQLPGYAGSRPVRVGNAAQGQVQLDVFGPVADLIADLATYRGGGPLALHEHEWRLLCQMVDAVQRRWAEPDAGIGEIRDTPRHHVYSRVMCWLTVHRAIEVAESMGRSQDGWATLRDTIAADVIEKGFDPTRGVYVSAYDRMEIDASALSIGTSGLLAADDPRFLATVNAVEDELRDGPTVFRYRHDDGLPGQEGGMHICTTWLIEAYLRAGRRDEAIALFEDLLELAGPTGLLSEQYDARTQRSLGNHPQAYSHLGVIHCALALDRFPPAG